MIPLQLVNEVRRLLATGMSQRKVAAMTGVSRGTVAEIRAGSRPDCHHRRAGRVATDGTADTGSVARCSGCGGMVHLPCRLCRTRALKEMEQARRRRIAQYIAELSSPCITYGATFQRRFLLIDKRKETI